MKYQFTFVLLISIISCTLQKKPPSLTNCFYIAQYPEFKFGESIDTSRIPFQLMPYDTKEEDMREHLLHSSAYICLIFDGGISTLLFTLEKSDQTLNGITAMWTILADPKTFFQSLKETYLPCIPIETLLKNPNVPIEDKSHGMSEFYQYINNYTPGDVESLHYWVGIKY